MRLAAWRHLALLTALGVLFVFLSDLLTGAPIRANGWPDATTEALRGLPDSLYLVLPAMLGIAVGTLGIGHGSVRSAAWMVVVVTAAMLALDVLAPHGAADKGVIGTGVAAMAGRLDGVHEILTTYPRSHPRFVAEQTVVRASMLLLPVVIVGLVLGVSAWIHARVVFRAPRDELIARWVLSWLLVPGATAILLGWSSGYGYEILFRGESLWLPLVPYAPALAIAAVGWRAVARPDAVATTPGLGAPDDR